jgi:hypothetical protein
MMRPRSLRRLEWQRHILLLSAAAVAACGHDGGTGPSNGPPAHLDASSSLTRTATVGTAVTGGLVVKVTDASGRPVQGTGVAFAVTAGNGTTSPRLATTDASGQATTVWTLGTIVGANEVTATVSGVSTPIKFQATGVAGAVTSISVSPPNARMLPTVDTLRITVQSLDAFGNATSPPPTLTPRDPTVVSVDANGLVHALKRGASTYVVASAGGKADSALVTVLATGQSICTGTATSVELSVGQVLTDVSGLGICVHASSPDAEYAIIPFYNSSIPSATIPIEVRGQNIVRPTTPVTSLQPSPSTVIPAPSLVPDDEFENRLRASERVEMPKMIASARSWMGARRDLIASGAVTQVVPNVGDLMNLNTNASDFCANPDVRTGRVVSITDKAIVVADTANPAGGFTDADYRSIGVTFDTLIDPMDRAAFGAPSDIDNNGHVILFFTRAVNEKTPAAASSVVLGLFYARDLYPKTASPGPCVGSNVAEMFYLLVPDPDGVVNTNKRSKAQVVSFTNGTVAHEYQHLINASRRMYVNGGGTVTEESWLNEGLSHIAEQLGFFRSSGRGLRQNLDASGFSDPVFAAAFATFENNNFNRYKTYLARPEQQSPIGVDIFDDDLPTRGAIWSFLRYAADHLPNPAQENTFWFNLVNTKLTGIANLTSVLGKAPNGLLRDWAISVFLDDNAQNVDPRFQQPTWNLRSAMTNGGTGLAFPLATRTLSDNITSSTTLVGNGVSFYRFSVPSSQDGLLTVTSGGTALPSTLQLALVRVR